jgi:hypothetical protein
MQTIRAESSVGSLWHGYARYEAVRGFLHDARFTLYELYNFINFQLDIRGAYV